MRVLVCHNEYLLRGGEERVVDTECALLRASRHDVVSVTPSSQDFLDMPLLARLRTASLLMGIDSRTDDMRRHLSEHQPDVVHFHNIIPSFGPSAIRAAGDFGCATVRTLHNYRLTCLAGTHYRNGSVCESCSSRTRRSGIARGCYRASRLQSLSMARVVRTEWHLAQQHHLPDVFVCLTEFARQRFITAGLPSERLVVKPNSVDYGHPLPWSEREGACFVGRLSREKGILELALTWPEGGPPLTIVGDGPLMEQVLCVAQRKASVVVLGRKDAAGVRQALRGSRVTVVPSLSYEGLPTVALEALSEGTPVVAFDHGWFSEFRESLSVPSVPAGDVQTLVDVAVATEGLARNRWEALSVRAVDLHAERFSHEKNIQGLAAVYERAMALRAKRKGGR